MAGWSHDQPANRPALLQVAGTCYARRIANSFAANHEGPLSKVTFIVRIFFCKTLILATRPRRLFLPSISIPFSSCNSTFRAMSSPYYHDCLGLMTPGANNRRMSSIILRLFTISKSEPALCLLSLFLRRLRGVSAVPLWSRYRPTTTLRYGFLPRRGQVSSGLHRSAVALIRAIVSRISAERWS